ncbi:hypothetical protein Tco_0450095 [Tanacetum coccineum]
MAEVVGVSEVKSEVEVVVVVLEVMAGVVFPWLEGVEVKGGGIDFGVSKSLLGEISRVAIGEGGGEPFGDDGGPVG